MSEIDTFGNRLRQERERLGITLDEVAKATKVAPHLLEALEGNDFARLPGGPFNKGFVRAYARFVGLDPEATVAAYAREEKAQGLSTPDAEREPWRPLSRFVEFRVEDDRKTLVLDWAALQKVLLAGIAVGLVASSAWILLRIGSDGKPALGASSPGTPTPDARAPGATPAGSAARDAESHPAAGPIEPFTGSGTAASRSPSSTPSRSSRVPGAPPASRLSVSESGVGTAVVNRQLLGQGDRFEEGTRIWFWTRTVGGKAGDRLRHVWLHKGRPVASHERTVGGSHWRNFSRHTLGAGSGGRWAVEARDASDRVLARQEFTCVRPR